MPFQASILRRIDYMNIQGMRQACKHGLVTMRLLHKLGKLGLKIELYYVHVGRESDLEGCEQRWEQEFPEYEAGFVGVEDMQETASCESWLTEAMLVGRLERGLTCFAIKHHGRIIAYLWSAFEIIDGTAYKAKLKENEAYLFNAYTDPEYRGKGLAPLMRNQCYKALKDRGVDVFYSVCDYFNTPSVRYKKKMNARVHKLGLFVAIGNKYSRSWILKEYG